ncbi:MAG: hypothetical protein HQK72_13485 [Desulfamplus sp.]|nr:hypothetical protein [Desulfamplus sp.]
MNEIYLQLREEARNIVASLPLPQFYQKFQREIDYSRQMLNSHPMLVKIKEEITPLIEDDFGHGMRHSDLVCIDAGAIVQIEIQNQEINKLSSQSSQIKENENSDIVIKSNIKIETSKIEQILLVQVAGLLHDIKRKEKHHSAEGAKFAKIFLSDGKYPLTEEDIEIVCCAINEHEAFQKKQEDQEKIMGNGHIESDKNQNKSLISNALYDADKFRWGPDNFTHTVWDMVMFSKAPISEFVKRYPIGMNVLEQIKSTFRTETGKLYGPNFISIGIEIGNRLFKVIEKLNLNLD